MRIISGKFKGRTLMTPPEGTRPTADRAKEMLFDILTSRFIKEGKRWEQLTFADVFAGSGAVGLEAASRGCKQVYLFEHDINAQKTIRQNGLQMTFDLLGDALYGMSQMGDVGADMSVAASYHFCQPSIVVGHYECQSV